MQNIYNLDNETIEKSTGINLKVNADLEEIYNNTIQNIGISCDKKCSNCLGVGYRIDWKSVCDMCNGKKIVKQFKHLKKISTKILY